MSNLRITRRTFLGAALPLLAACTTPLPLGPRPSSEKSAAIRLQDSAEAHGLDAYRGVNDLSVSYDGQWRSFVGTLQPDLVDPAWRGSSQERVIPPRGFVAQEYTGTAGHKHVVWHRGSGEPGHLGDVSVWRNGVRASDAPTLQSAALVAEAYAVFLFGPMWLADRGLTVRSAGTEKVDGRLCDVVDVWMRPGFGQVDTDRLSLCIDRADDITRRFRLTLEGTAATKGAVAEIDTFDHVKRFGMTWPTRFHERVVHPIHIPAHDWHVTGLDVNRGFTMADLSGPTFMGRAIEPAAPL